MQKLHKFFPKTQREKSLVLLFSVASSVVTSALMTQEWFMGYNKASKSVQADSPPIVLGDPIVLKDPAQESPLTVEKSTEQETGLIPGGIITGGRSPSEYAVTREFSAPQSASLIRINRYQCNHAPSIGCMPVFGELCQKLDQTSEYNEKLRQGWKITNSHPDTLRLQGHNVECLGTRYILSSN